MTGRPLTPVNNTGYLIEIVPGSRWEINKTTHEHFVLGMDKHNDLRELLCDDYITGSKQLQKFKSGMFLVCSIQDLQKCLGMENWWCEDMAMVSQGFSMHMVN